MKLGKVTTNDPPKRLALSVRSSTVSDLERYQDFYKQETGEDIPMSLLVEEMTKRFMLDDKAFQRFKKAPKPQANVTSSSVGNY